MIVEVKTTCYFLPNCSSFANYCRNLLKNLIESSILDGDDNLTVSTLLYGNTSSCSKAKTPVLNTTILYL